MSGLLLVGCLDSGAADEDVDRIGGGAQPAAENTDAEGGGAESDVPAATDVDSATDSEGEVATGDEPVGAPSGGGEPSDGSAADARDTPDGEPPPPVVGTCPSGCDVLAICQLCDDGSCARAVVDCNSDGTCGGIDWICPDGGEQPLACESMAREYVGDSPEQCALLDFVCPDGREMFFDECGCGCLVSIPDMECDDPNRSYVATSQDECARIRFACAEGEEAFSDPCGCGCESSAGACTDAESLLVSAWEEAASCAEDADCRAMLNPLCGSGAQGAFDGCYIMVNQAADLSALETALEQTATCVPFGADCNCASPPAVGCVEARCAAIEPADDASLCESTGGTWYEGSCGDYYCGLEPACDALIPGCDCGPLSNFSKTIGCTTDPACGLD